MTATISGSNLLVEISAGELLDKLTILEIKLARIQDAAKQRNVETEWRTLTETWERQVVASTQLGALREQLKIINEKLWDIEDAIRDCERRQDFGNEFIRLARAVYQTNDQRAAIKRQVNDLLGSRLIEEKSYAAY